MLQLEDLRQDAQVGGILANQAVTVVDIRWYGSQALELTYKDQSGKLGNQLLYRTDEARLEIVSAGRNWSFDADGAKRSASGVIRNILVILDSYVHRRCCNRCRPRSQALQACVRSQRRVLQFRRRGIPDSGRWRILAVVEPDHGSSWTGIWWAAISTTTAGNGDIAPVKVIERMTAVILMLIGIGWWQRLRSRWPPVSWKILN